MEELRYIKLSNFNIHTMVDLDDYEKYKHYKWHMDKLGYVKRAYWEDGKPKTTSLHRDVMNNPKGMDVDHIDQNRLNNRKSNLRIATRSQNMANVRKIKKEKARSLYKGVSYLDRKTLTNKWTAYIKKDYVMYNLGYFLTEEEAAIAYDCAAIQLFDEFASFNIL